MAFGLDSLRDFENSLNSLGEQANISENSANERNDKLCKALGLINDSLQFLTSEIHYLGQVEFLALQVVTGENENESTSFER